MNVSSATIESQITSSSDAAKSCIKKRFAIIVLLSVMGLSALSIAVLIPLLGGESSPLGIVYASASVAFCLAVFIFAAGLRDMNGRIDFWRRCLAMIVVSMLLGLLFFGVINSFDELFGPPYSLSMDRAASEAYDAKFRSFQPLANMASILLGIGWVTLSVALLYRSARWTRVEFFKRVAHYLMIMCVIELAISLMSYRLDTGFLAGLAGMMGILIGVLVLNFAIGVLGIWHLMRRVAAGGTRG